MTRKIQAQRAYITRRTDLDNATWCQDEAAVLAFRDGDMDEMARRERKAREFRAKTKRSEIAPLPAAIIQALGKQDAISNMLKDRYLQERHGRTALHLRDYMVLREVHMGGSGNLVFVDGGVKSEMIDRIAGLRAGAQAVSAGELTLPSQEFVKPATGLLCGHINMTQAGRLIGGDTGKAQTRVKQALRNYLEAAEPFFGRFT